MYQFFNYASIEDRDFTVTLLSDSTGGHDEEWFIQDLLVKAASEGKVSRLIVAIKNETYILHTVHVTETSVFTVEDVVSKFDEFVRSSRDSSISTFYKVEPDFSDSQLKFETSSCLTTLSRTRGAFFNSLSWPAADSELLMVRLESEKCQSTIGRLSSLLTTARQFWKERWSMIVLFWSTLVAIWILLAIIYRGGFTTTFDQHFENGIWVRYDLKSSQGPKYQLQFSHRNVSSWAAKNPHDNNEWALRIDDQAMIPAHLMDEEELLYQRWFRERYPEKEQIRLNRDYINETFLSDPDQIKVPSDVTFHMAHCVRALRRYWQAKETGKHVCPRDIDFRHIKHCLDSLDSWAFPDGERGSVKQMEESGTWHLIWETKVCF